MHDRTTATLTAAAAFVEEAASRTPPQLAKFSSYADRAGRLQAFEIAVMQQERDKAENAIMRSEQILADLGTARATLDDEARRAGTWAGYDDSAIRAAEDKVQVAAQSWGSIATGLRGFIAQAEAGGWANGG